MAQPMEYVYLLAADAQLERETAEAAAPQPAGASASSGRQRIIRYVMKPKE